MSGKKGRMAHHVRFNKCDNPKYALGCTFHPKDVSHLQADMYRSFFQWQVRTGSRVECVECPEQVQVRLTFEKHFHIEAEGTKEEPIMHP